MCGTVLRHTADKGVPGIRTEQFNNYIEQYQKLVFSICLSYTKNYFDAEDLTQETFYAAYKKLDSFDGRNFKAWITTIAANKCRDYLRTPQKRNPAAGEVELELLEDNRDAPEETAVKRSEEEMVFRLCKRLKEPYRSVAVGYFCEDKTLADISKASGKNLKTLQTQLYRAKKLLAALWKEESA